MTRTDVINASIDANGYRSYLEIGVRDPNANFAKIKAIHKTAVDPNMRVPDEEYQLTSYHKVTSDEFFARAEGKWDLIFIDGDHSEAQSKRDLLNSLKHLSPGGTIVMHDCFPMTAEEALPEKPNNGMAWCGEVYRVFSYARTRKDLIACCINCDHGCGIIKRGRNRNRVTFKAEYGYGIFVRQAARWLGIVDPIHLEKVL